MADLIAVRSLTKARSIACPETPIGCCYKLAEIARITACLLTKYLKCHEQFLSSSLYASCCIQGLDTNTHKSPWGLS